jgi:[protein-PII] uridylyltransferase
LEDQPLQHDTLPAGPSTLKDSTHQPDDVTWNIEQSGNGLVRVTGNWFLDNPLHQALQLFSHAQQQGLNVHPETLRRIRELSPTLAQRNYRADTAVQKIFRELLGRPGRVGRVLRQLHEARLLSALVPAFKRVTGRVQSKFFHQYTVDEHTLVCLEKLDQIWNQNENLLNGAFYTEMFRQVARPDLLYLALLFHDIGKGVGNDHSISGAHIAAVEARRLGFSSADVQRVTFLVRHHLSMVVISQKRDLDDPEVIHNFARLVGDTENLRMLTLLTLTDSLGTSDTLWNGFKDALLRTLFARTLQYLTGTVVPAAAIRRSELREQISKIAPASLAPDEIEAHFAGLPESYFLHITPEELIADLNVVHDFLARHVDGQSPPLAPAICAQDLPDHSCTVIRVCMWDHSGLFARLAAALTAAGLNIFSAEIYTRADHLALDRFYVSEPRTGGPASEPALATFAALAEKALAGEVDLPELLFRAREFRASAPVHSTSSTRITFDNQASAKRTILEIQTHDRLGLLAVLAATLADLDVDISLAKVNTHHGMADDAFYVTEANGQPILASERQELIRARLIAALAELP